MRDYSPTDPAVMLDPYPYYAELRRGPAVAYVEADDVWVVSTFDAVDEALRQPAVFSSVGQWALLTGNLSARNGPRPNIIEHAVKQPKNLLASDPPIHMSLRRMTSKMFTARAVDGYEQSIRGLCSSLIDRIIEKGSTGQPVDLIDGVFRPLPLQVIARILGIDDEYFTSLTEWTEMLVDRQQGVNNDESATKLRRMRDYFYDLLQARRSRPGEDLIDLLISENMKSEEKLTDFDLFNFFTLLVVAGHETTTGLLSNLFAALFEDADQLKHAWRTTDVAAVVEEGLRYETTTQGIPRMTKEDIQFRNIAIPARSMVLLIAGSANRDENRWQKADRFDAARERKNHIGFGTGIHSCLGASLARLETRVAIEVMRERISHLAPASAPVRAVTPVLRGFSSMPVHITAR